MARIQPTTDDNRKDERLQLHNKTYRVIVKATGQILYGTVSRVDYINREFYLLRPDQPGMIGKDGTKFSWDDCAVAAETDRVGEFSEDMIKLWQSWYVKSGVETK